jgi:hypothetical protein
MQEIIIEIDEKGDSVKFEVNGVNGPECKSLTAALEAAVGETVNVEEKSEYNMVRTHTREVVR